MDMERGLLMLMLTTVVDSSVKPVAIMEAMVDLPTPSESALLMPKPTMAATAMARGPLMPMPTMVVMAMADMEAMAATDTARGPLMPMPTMAVMAMADMEAMAATDTARGP